VKKGITFHLARTMEDVLGYAFPGLDLGSVKAPGTATARRQSAAAHG
jgi:hypothetical protein